MAIVERLQPAFTLEAEGSVALIRLYYPKNIAVTNVKVKVSEEGSGNNFTVLNFHPISPLYLAICQDYTLVYEGIPPPDTMRKEYLTYKVSTLICIGT